MTSPKPLQLDDAVDGVDLDAHRFAALVVDDVSRRLSYRQENLLAAIQQHVRWAHVVSGLPLEREFLFRRDVIAVAVQQLPMKSDASLGRRRAILLRVAEALGVTERAMPPLYGSEPSAPYADGEVAELRIWSAIQQESRREPARILLALGIGAGLTASELCAVAASDISSDASWVEVSGTRPRVVHVEEEWRDPLLGALHITNGPIFQSNVRWYPNKISDFVRTTRGDQLRPKPQRMRATWLVRRMTDGIPVQDLLYAAGVKSLDALARFERFLPAPAAAPSPDSHGRR